MTAPGPFFSTTSENSKEGPAATHKGPSSETNGTGVGRMRGVPTPGSRTGEAAAAAVAGDGAVASVGAQAQTATSDAASRSEAKRVRRASMRASNHGPAFLATAAGHDRERCDELTLAPPPSRR